MRMRSTVLWLPCAAALASTVSAEVGVIVNRDLHPSVRPAVRTYVADLRAEGTSVWLDTTSFAAGNTLSDVRRLRDSLKAHWNKPADKLDGAVLIGNLPTAMFEVADRVYPVDCYFMDLTVTETYWQDRQTTAPYQADVFDQGPNPTYDIWVSRVIAHNLAYDSLGVTLPGEAGHHQCLSRSRTCVDDGFCIRKVRCHDLPPEERQPGKRQS